ncbi:MAG TPA: RNA polymerase sigma-70 factor [Niastella sp.]|nr:RNA polymerase sigma-70 factor [Niastella sp.]
MFYIFKRDYFCHIKNFSQHTDQELLQFWQQGNEQAFELIYKKYAVQLLAIAMQKLYDHALAQEMVQEVFLTLYKNRSSLPAIPSLMAYLYVALKNKILDHYRHQLVHKKYEHYAAAMASETDHSTQQWIDTRELEKQLHSAIEKLPPQCRNVFKLSRVEELPNKKIAARLSISENTVEQHMRKALRLLREAFYSKKLVD